MYYFNADTSSYRKRNSFHAVDTNECSSNKVTRQCYLPYTCTHSIKVNVKNCQTFAYRFIQFLPSSFLLLFRPSDILQTGRMLLGAGRRKAEKCFYPLLDSV